MANTSVKSIPITENEYVKQLMAVLQKNNAPSKKDFIAVIGHVTAMENQLEQMIAELQAMRRDLAEAQRQNHPVRHALQKAVIVMQAQISELRKNLTALKENIIDGCKNALAAFKEKGISALDNIARFFKVKPVLEAIHTGADKAAKSADKTIANIEAASAKYHEAGRRVKNAGRALSGKEAIQEAKPSGKVTKAFTAPARAVRSCFKGIRNNAVAAVGKLRRLEERAAEKKQSINDTLKECNELVKQAEKERKTPTRTRAAER